MTAEKNDYRPAVAPDDIEKAIFLETIIVEPGSRDSIGDQIFHYKTSNIRFE